MEIGQWLVGTKQGLFGGVLGGSWARVGAAEFRVTSLARRGDRVFAGVGSGVWEAGPDGSWKQLHDETLTEVLDLALIGGDPGLVAASAYGVATARRDDLGAARWSFWSDPLRVNERYSNAVLVLDDQRWLVGTEGGLLMATQGGRHWDHSDLLGCPVRALCAAHGAYWAGTDGRGCWRSQDGLRWEPAGVGLESGTVLALAATSRGLLAGTLDGVACCSDGHFWQRTGPRLLVAAVAVAPGDGQLWVAAADPGGLWVTVDGGRAWSQQVGLPVAMEAVLAPADAASSGSRG